MKKVGMLVSGIVASFIVVTAWGQSTFTTGMHDEKVETEMELVTLDGQTYFETKEAGVYLGSTDDMADLLTPAILKEATGRKSGRTDGIAATVKGHPISGFRATAGQKGMHVSVDLQAGGMNFGKGMLYDLLKLHREIVFEEGEIKLPKMESKKQIGFDIYRCAKGARIRASDQDRKLHITGISHEYVPTETGK